MTFRSALLAATMLAVPAIAMAQPVTGLYIGGGIGPDYLMSQTPKSSAAGASLGKIQGNVGFGSAASVGYGLGNGLRLEGQIDYLNNVPHVKGTGVNGGGTIQNYGLFANGLYDFAMPAGSIFNPYAGLGVGYQITQLSSFNFYAPGGTSSTAVKNASKGAVAAQLILGTTFPIAAVPGLGVTLEYRFIADFNAQKYGTTTTPSSTGTSVKLATQYDHALLVGLRYAFGVAPAPMAAAPAATPAPVVAPAPAPARSYLVFFDWDKADLTARAQQIIAEAAQASTRVATTRIDVAGHADKSGTAPYNQALSLRRANNVASELIRLGVPRAAISITAFGDTKPLVPTAPGVREPQNRRVEIVLK